MIFRPLSFALLFICLLAPLDAQTILDSGKYFRTFGASFTPPTTPIYYQDDGKDIPIAISDRVRHGFYDAKALLSPLVFYVIKPGPDGSPVRVAVGQADISQGGTLPLLIFSDNPSAPGTYQIQVLPEDLRSFPMGGYEVINGSPQPARVYLGKQPTDVPPGQSRPASYEPPLGEGSGAVEAFVYVMQNNVPKLVFANTWRHTSLIRTLVLLRPMQNHPNLVTVGYLSENLPALLSKGNLPTPPPPTHSATQ